MFSVCFFLFHQQIRKNLLRKNKSFFFLSQLCFCERAWFQMFATVDGGYAAMVEEKGEKHSFLHDVYEIERKFIFFGNAKNEKNFLPFSFNITISRIEFHPINQMLQMWWKAFLFIILKSIIFYFIHVEWKQSVVIYH